MNYLVSELESVELSLERQHRYNLDMHQMVTRILGIYENMQQTLNSLHRRQTTVYNEMSILSAIQRQQSQRTQNSSTSSSTSSSRSNRRWESTSSPLSRPNTPLFTSMNSQNTPHNRTTPNLLPLRLHRSNFMSQRYPFRSTRLHNSRPQSTLFTRPTSTPTSTPTYSTNANVNSGTRMERLNSELASMVNSIARTAFGVNSTYPDASFSTTTSLHFIPLNLDNVNNQTIRNDEWINNLNLSPVIVRPSEEEIDRAITNIRYSSSIEQTIDPIDQIQFTNNEELVRLNQCGHVFRSANIRTWFHNSVHCPLCRIDIRETQRATREEFSDINENETDNEIDNENETDNETDNEDTSVADMDVENILHYYSDDSVGRV